MNNILLLCEAYGGGVKTYIDAIITNKESFPNAKFEVLVSSNRLESTAKVNKDYIIDNNLSFGKSPLKVLRALKAIHSIVKKNNINIIHANSTFSGVLIYIYSFFNRKISFLYTPHGYYSLKSMSNLKKKLVRFVEKKINHICFKVIHVSNSEENEAIKHKIVEREKSIVIFNGVKEPSRNRMKNNQKDLFTIVNLARVDDQKNPFEFIELAKHITDDYSNVQFIWAGNGKYLEEARNRVRKLNKESRIKFIGFSDNKDELLAKADLYFSTSFYEGLPFSVIEAMSYKLPLALSNIVGHTDLINEGKNGLLYEHNDYASIQKFIQIMISNPEIRMELSSMSYKYYKENFSLEVMLKNLSVIYESYSNTTEIDSENKSKMYHSV